MMLFSHWLFRLKNCLNKNTLKQFVGKGLKLTTTVYHQKYLTLTNKETTDFRHQFEELRNYMRIWYVTNRYLSE